LWADVLVECPGDREALAKIGRGSRSAATPVQKEVPLQS
jgi:hypothetical protein